MEWIALQRGESGRHARPGARCHFPRRARPAGEHHGRAACLAQRNAAMRHLPRLPLKRYFPSRPMKSEQQAARALGEVA
ncbi:hypothetical protein [Achromobacter sp. Marseille-Q4962]|uniref:hypothetical protein n=1 Tax=Achromobacter sp. Marseille-Q4962 TaxID=2942202 RepID=UPI002073B00A|nr:hypothetical protein [Achromobacter sp. Marseille-Q4962]